MFLTLIILITTISVISAAEDTSSNSQINDTNTDIQTTHESTTTSDTQNSISENSNSNPSSIASTTDTSTTKTSSGGGNSDNSNTATSQHTKDSTNTVSSKTITKDSDTKTSDNSYNYNSEDNSQKEVTTEIQNDNSVKTLDSTDGSSNVSSFRELATTLSIVESQTSGDSYTINLQPNSDSTAYDITSTLSWSNSGSIKNLIINGNGVTINGNNNYQFMTIATDYTLVLNNVTIANCYVQVGNGGTINNAGNLTLLNSQIINSSTYSNGAAIYNTGNLTLINTSIDNSFFTGNYGYGGAIYSNNLLTIINSSFENNVAGMNGGAILSTGQATISNSKFTNNSAQGGGAIYGNGNLTVTNCTFDSNNGSETSGAIYYSGSNAFFVLENSSITNSVSKSGAVYVINSHNTTIKNSTFTNNNGTNNGGAIYIDNSEMTITDSYFSNNEATNNGGAIYPNKGNLTVIGSIFESNTAQRGAAIYNVNSNITINNTQANKNYVSRNGGAIYNDGANCNLTVTNSTFSENKADSNAGALYNNYGILTIIDSEITNNTATSGAIYNGNSGATVTITNSNFTYNTATDKGGAIHNDGETVIISSSDFSYNTADRGGAIYNTNGGKATITNSTLLENTATTSANAIYNIATLSIDDNLIQNTIVGAVNQEITLDSPIHDSELSSTEDVKITINDEKITVNPIDGEVKTTYTFTDSGKIIVEIEYPSYEDNSIQILAMIEGELVVRYNGSTTAGSTITLIADLSNLEVDDTGYVIFKVNGKTLKDENGENLKIDVNDKIATTNYTLPHVSVVTDYNISAVFYGDTVGVIRSDNTTITITLDSANIELSTDGKLTPGNTVTFKAVITDEDGNNVTSGRAVFKLNGVSLKNTEGNVIYVDVDNGVAILNYTIPDNYSAKDYTLTAVFQDTGFERTEENMTITLIKTETAIQVDESIITSGSNDTITITQGENLQLKATIIDESTGSAVTGTTKVSVKINNKTVLQEYVTDGVIDITLYTYSFKNPTYTIEIIAGENSQYQKSTYNGTLTVLEPNSLLIKETSNNGTLLVVKE